MFAGLGAALRIGLRWQFELLSLRLAHLPHPGVLTWLSPPQLPTIPVTMGRGNYEF